MSKKQFHISTKNIKRLVNNNGGCIASHRITLDGYPVGYMYREPPNHDVDTGWRFMAGDESDEYMDNANNHGVYAINTIANSDHDILPFLTAPLGSAFTRYPETGKFVAVESPIDPEDGLQPNFPIATGYYSITASWSVFLPLLNLTNASKRIR
ncbi:MAG: DUF2185 domain-containing protein [Cyanobacteria bacterium P01_G01_bin.54]